MHVPVHVGAEGAGPASNQTLPSPCLALSVPPEAVR